MAEIAAFSTSQPVAVTLGSVVGWAGEHGVVWHVTGDTLRILPITRGTTPVPLSLANEVALHLPVSQGGWSVACDELVTWPRWVCAVIGELDERCLLRILQMRKTAKPFNHCVVANAVATSRLRRAL
jgi:hypothetical protein